jgi:uncharacterized protein YkwD
MAQKPQKKSAVSKRSKSSKRSGVTCAKSHGHLVCWITTKKQPNKRRIFFNFIIPGTHNQHKPHLIRRSSLLAIALLLVGLQVGYNYIIAGQARILGYATNVSAQAVRTEINESRLQNGFSELTADEQLNKAASLKAEDMFTKGYWSHNAPDGTQPWKWFESAGYDYQNAGENLAKDFKTSEGVTRAWLNSASHKKNMLNPEFENVGVAVVNGSLGDKETTLVVTLFGTRKSASSGAEDGAITSTTTSYSSNMLANPAQISALLNPISIITLATLLGVAIVALLTHWHYVKLPRKIRKSWYRHHALYIGSFALLAITYTAYIFTSGSI